MVRAKFRCMSVAKEWSGHTKVELQPVMKSDKHPENAVWSKYTPSGSCSLSFNPKAAPEFTPGDYYFIDMEEAEEGERLWKLWELQEQEGQITVKLSPKWEYEEAGLQSGSYEATINNEECWPHYRGKVGSKWQVSFSFACSSADGEE